MADSIFVVPAPGITLRHPSNLAKQIPAEGAHVPHDSFTRRRIKEGDLVVPAAASKPAEQPKPSRRADAPSE